MYLELRASLPLLDGERLLTGLDEPVRVERDALGIPTLRGQNRRDLARALGFVHAQDRFFQMDLIRRQAAGELAELLGDALLEADRRFRVHRFRARAREVLETLPAPERELARAYAEGVNAGLEALSAPPFEYRLQLARPAPWRPEDILLAAYTFYLDLNDEQGRRESARGLVHDLLGPEMERFLSPAGTEWDAPVVGEPFSTPPVPGPEVADLRSRAPTPRLRPRGRPALPLEDRAAGSNNWAVAGRLTAHGGAILANDMHLGLAVPNTWYRARLVYPDPAASDGERRLTGVTFPGTPFLVAGSNGQIAWGFTNTYGDWEDLVVLDSPDPDGSTYRTPQGVRPFVRHREVLRTRGGQEQILEIEETEWGPVIDRDHRGRRRALRWIAHDRRAVTFGLLDLERAATVDQAVAAAAGVGAPPQNLVVADDAGRIGWTVMGPLPRRFGHDGRLPASWADGRRGWRGWLEPREYPRVVEPTDGRLWTANSRAVDGEAMATIGIGTYQLGARAGQIEDRLSTLRRSTEADHLAIQLDDRARFLARWRTLLLQQLDDGAGDPQRRELRRLVTHWGGRAAIDSAGYRLVRLYRELVADAVMGWLTAPCRQADPRFDYRQLLQHEGPLWRLVSERPEHLLDPRFDSWEKLLRSAVATTLEISGAAAQPLAEFAWGARNRVAIRHPFSPALKPFRRWLDMPPRALPGDDHMPRFQAPTEGASQRMVVSPGREESGIFHMPAGQSGHPLSPHYRDQHEAWAAGRPTAFLPGPPLHTLILRPPPGG